jgi:hypothetical protein
MFSHRLLEFSLSHRLRRGLRYSSREAETFYADNQSAWLGYTNLVVTVFAFEIESNGQIGFKRFAD